VVFSGVAVSIPVGASETESPQAHIDRKTRKSRPFASLQTRPILYTSLRNIAGFSAKKKDFQVPQLSFRVKAV
jgi:hypothetical protein